MPIEPAPTSDTLGQPITSRPTQGSVIINIQALRALAAVMVIFVHLELVMRPMGATHADAAMFTAGVDLFFVISGFIMVYTTTLSRPTPMEFFTNRVARLVPIYWVFTLAAFAVAVFFPVLLTGTASHLLDLARSLFFIPYVRDDGLIRPILFVGWSLNLEMMFYVLFTVSLALPGARAREGVLIAVLALLVLWHERSAGAMPPTVGFLTQPLIFEFAIGMMVGMAVPYIPHGRIAGAVALIAAPLLVVALLWFSRFPVPLFFPATALPATGLLIAALVAERSGFRLDQRWIIMIGDASYALYLCHPFITQAVTTTAVELHALNAVSAPFLVALSLSVAVLVAILTNRHIERPLVKVTRRLLGAHRLKPVSSALT